MKHSYLVEIAPCMRFECVADGGPHFKSGDAVVVTFDKYEDGGKIVRHLGEIADQSGDETPSGRGRPGAGGADEGGCQRCQRSGTAGATPKLVRHMSVVDRGRAHENEVRAQSMFKTAQRKIKEHHLTMKLVGCHYSLDKSIAFFLFSSESRVDFRSLVRDLSGALHTRIELRQIGVRDEASLVGGIGPCGRVFCCAGDSGCFQSVNVKMAKIQRLSLNPASVSGGCGRLKCCLRYEVDGYKEMCRSLPRNGSLCQTPDGMGRVMDCNALTQRVRVRLQSGVAQFKEYDVDEIEPAPPPQSAKSQNQAAGKADRPAAAGEAPRARGQRSRGGGRGGSQPNRQPQNADPRGDGESSPPIKESS